LPADPGSESGAPESRLMTRNRIPGRSRNDGAEKINSYQGFCRFMIGVRMISIKRYASSTITITMIERIKSIELAFPVLRCIRDY
jgi:hypothetical protein